MAKKPILTDDELDGGLPPRPATPPPLPGASSGVTRPLGVPAAESTGASTRMVDDPTPDEAPHPPPAQKGRDASGHARPKTRIHGYGNASRVDEVAEAAEPDAQPVVGWLVVTSGPGRGAAVGLSAGMNAVGRGPENAAQVDFGDDTISRDAHAYVTYDHETRRFHLSHGGKTNLVRLNDAPVLTAESLSHGDTIRIGASALRFVALCGPDFDWADA
ncbi:FHA domain-containing protein [Gymnodinialimonas hymeniacidonis]|uniref:FHA domain-containing protein n=1 Tax=Gymnodinialimonas hymeniacidonis TaxID=3126508 RepID=UPI0034C6B5EA